MSESLLIRIEELEEENRQLREIAFGVSWCPPFEFGLTRSEEAILRALVKHERCSHELLRLATLQPGQEDDRTFQVISVFVSKTRRKLKPYEIEIQAIWGQGYRLSDEDRSRLLGWNKEAAPHE